jgi:hypothetical protein
MERGKHETLSMFGNKKKLGQFFKGPMFGVEIKSLVISNWIKQYKGKKFGDGVCMSC